jgi:hypothetical protein
MIFGQEDEDTYHALVTCLHPRGLWHAMRQCWDLPGKGAIQRTGSDRILDLLPKLNKALMAHMIFWRAWHVHNQLTHDKPSPPVKASW